MRMTRPLDSSFLIEQGEPARPHPPNQVLCLGQARVIIGRPEIIVEVEVARDEVPRHGEKGATGGCSASRRETQDLTSTVVVRRDPFRRLVFLLGTARVPALTPHHKAGLVCSTGVPCSPERTTVR
jgi:hypothetical protein